MGGRLYVVYTWSYCCFNWYHWILSIGINIDILYTHICLKGKILSIGKIGIKMLICLLINWYQDFSFSIGIWFGINMHFIDIFLIGIIFNLTPFDIVFVLDKKGENILFYLITLYWFYVSNKKGEKNVLFLFGPLCWWLTKRGRRILYACFICMFCF